MGYQGPYTGPPAQLALEVDVSDVVKVGEEFHRMAKELKRNNKPLEVGITNAEAGAAYQKIIKQYGKRIRKMAADKAPVHKKGRLANPNNYRINLYGGTRQTNARPMVSISVSPHAGGDPLWEGLPSWVHDGTKDRWTRNDLFRGRIHPGNPWLEKNIPEIQLFIGGKFEKEINRLLARKFDKGMAAIGKNNTKTPRTVKSKEPPRQNMSKTKQKQLDRINKKEGQAKRDAANLAMQKQKLRKDMSDTAKMLDKTKKFQRKGKTMSQIKANAQQRKNLELRAKQQRQQMSDIDEATKSAKAVQTQARQARTTLAQPPTTTDTPSPRQTPATKPARTATPKKPAAKPKKQPSKSAKPAPKKTTPKTARTKPADTPTLEELPAEVQKHVQRPTKTGSAPSKSTITRRIQQHEADLNRPTTYGGQTHAPSARTMRRRRAQARQHGFVTPDRRNPSRPATTRSAPGRTKTTRRPANRRSTTTKTATARKPSAAASATKTTSAKRTSTSTKTTSSKAATRRPRVATSSGSVETSMEAQRLPGLSGPLDTLASGAVEEFGFIQHGGQANTYSYDDFYLTWKF